MRYPGVNTITDLRFIDLHQRHWEEVDNHSDGNCLFEAVLDSANYYLHADHDLNRLFKGNGSLQRPLTHAQDMRKHLSNFNKLCLQNKQGFSQSEIASLTRSSKVLTAKKGTAKWGTTDEVNRIAHQYNIAIIIYSEPDQIWTSAVPRSVEIGDMNNYIVILLFIRNQY